MNVTPSKQMFAAMSAFVDSTIGEAPTDIETTPAAEKRRAARRIAFDFLHDLVRLSMREGVGRYLRERGMPTVVDDVKPNPIKGEKLNHPIIASAND